MSKCYPIESPRFNVKFSDYRAQALLDSRPYEYERVSDHIYKKLTTNEIYESDDDFISSWMSMGIKLHDFYIMELNITGSYILREWFYTINKKAWAMTTRRDTNWKLVHSSEAYRGSIDDEAFNIIEKNIEIFNKDPWNSQYEKLRGQLPMSRQCNFSLICSVPEFITTLATMYYYLDGTKFWEEVYLAVRRDIPQIKEYLKWIEKESTTKSKMNKYTLSNIKDFELIDPFDNKFGVGCILYSQMIRNDDVEVKGFFEYVQKKFNNVSEPFLCSDSFPCYWKISKERFIELIKLRTQWFTTQEPYGDNNNWSYLASIVIPRGAKLSKYGKYLPYFDLEGNFLQEEIDRTKADDSMRVTKGFTGAFPNAFSLESRKIVEQRIKRNGYSPITDMYLQMFDMGYVKDNPNNELRKKWEELNPELA